jgi:predicted 2-oxoglutarate/Fe(II)-dependent dioxygenase YbiX
MIFIDRKRLYMENKIIEYENGAFCIKNFFSEKECEELIESSESHGFEKAKIQSSVGQELADDIRNNDRILFDDLTLAKKLFERIRVFLPQDTDGWSDGLNWTLFGLNERFRFYRYYPKQYFKWHVDGSFRKNYGEVSKLTVIFYLNSQFEGGETMFENFTVSPEVGMALVFPHKVRHQGVPVLEGCKYVLRTDVMYSR